MNYFEIFNLEPTPELNVSELENTYRQLSLKWHPDRNLPSERVEAALKTTALNEAFQTLKSETKRYFYLLKLHGLDIEKDDAIAKTFATQDLLTEILELREKIQEASSSEREVVKKSAIGSFDASLKTAQAALQNLVNDDSQTNKNTAARALVRLRYFEKIIREIDEE